MDEAGKPEQPMILTGNLSFNSCGLLKNNPRNLPVIIGSKLVGGVAEINGQKVSWDGFKLYRVRLKDDETGENAGLLPYANQTIEVSGKLDEDGVFVIDKVLRDESQLKKRCPQCHVKNWMRFRKCVRCGYVFGENDRAD